MRTALKPRTAAATALLFLLAACGGSPAADSAGDALRLAGPFEIHSLEPIENGYVFTRLQVAETLVTTDIEGALVPGLATEWSAAANDTEWTFDLVADATFHDGTDLTGEAVVASLERAVAETASPLAEVPIEHIHADGSSVVFELSEPYLALPAMLTHYSAAILAPSSYDDHGHVTEVIGSGPYEVTDIELPASVKTTAFDDWRGEQPEIRDVTFQAVGRAETRAVMASSNQADVVFHLEPPGRERVEGTDGVRMESSLQPRTILLKLNGDHPALADVRVRRALSFALDRETMAEAVLREPELAATQLLPPTLTTWQHDVEPLVQDRTEADRLLSAAGWETGEDGVRHKDGEPLQLTLLTYPDRPELPALATAIQAALAEVGVDIKVNSTNSSEIPAGQADGSLELALIAKHFALVADPLVDIATVFAPEGSDWGVMNWQDPAVDDAITALLSGTGDAQAHRATIVETAQEELPLIPVAWYRMNAAVNDRVEDFAMDPLETTWRISDLRWAE